MQLGQAIISLHLRAIGKRTPLESGFDQLHAPSGRDILLRPELMKGVYVRSKSSQISQGSLRKFAHIQPPGERRSKHPFSKAHLDPPSSFER
jgi:hypothetical protein